MINFGDRLRSLRARMGMSQLEFAKQVKLSKSAVNMYERGEREPSFEVLEKIADYFNVDIDYLLGKSDVENKNRLCIDPKFELSSSEHELILKYRQLDPVTQSRVLNYLNYEFDQFVKASRLTLRMAGRDGRKEERHLTEEEAAQLKARYEQARKVPEDL